jgi:hypothetical protein
LALSLHKAQMAGLSMCLIAAKKSWRLVAAAATAALAVVIVFVARARAPLNEIWQSYIVEIRWWFGKTEAGGLRGMGSTHLYPVITALAAHHTVLASSAMYGLTFIGLILCIYLARRTDAALPSDLEMSGVLLLTLWAMYNGIYATVVLIIPICALYERLKRKEVTGGLRTLTTCCAGGLVVLWFIDARKAWNLIGKDDDLSRVPASGIYAFLDLSFRLIIFATFLLVIFLQWQERRSTSEAPEPRAMLVTN